MGAAPSLPSFPRSSSPTLIGERESIGRFPGRGTTPVVIARFDQAVAVAGACGRRYGTRNSMGSAASESHIISRKTFE